jgi:hypothetical protein
MTPHDPPPMPTPPPPPPPAPRAPVRYLPQSYPLAVRVTGGTYLIVGWEPSGARSAPLNPIGVPWTRGLRFDQDNPSRLAGDLFPSVPVLVRFEDIDEWFIPGVDTSPAGRGPSR